MLKIYCEHELFDKYSVFNTETGYLSVLNQSDFSNYLPSNIKIDDLKQLYGQVYDNKQFFLGPVSKYHTHFPRRIYFQITRKCNLLCDYCYIKSSIKQPHIPSDSIYKLAEYFSSNGLMEIRLTGGEPTLHPNFSEIVRKFHNENVYVSIATNGLWSANVKEYLCCEPYIWVICSVDGIKKTHNFYRPNTFDTIIANLQYLKNKNPFARIRLTTVLTKKNQHQMYELGRICQSVGAESITVIPLRPQVRDKDVINDMVDSNEFKAVIEDLIKAKEDFGIPFTTTMETEYKNQIYADPIVRKRLSCAAGREATNLDFDYKRNKFIVYACSYSPASDLSAHPDIRKPFLAGEFPPEENEKFLEIWNQNEVWEIYRDLSIRSRYCKGCSYLKNFQCTGSCPIQNIDYDKIDVTADVLEQLRHQLTKTGEWYCYKNVFNSNI